MTGECHHSFSRIVVDIAALLVRSEGHADIGNTVERNPVGDAALGRPRPQSASMADDPVGHESAVAAAGYADTLRVDRPGTA